MKQVTMHEAKTHLSRLVDLVLAGEEVVIARRDRPVARLTAIKKPGPERSVGALPGLIRAMGDDFNVPLEDWDERMVPSPRPLKRLPARRKKTGS